jgi:ankyrin repeat protein
MIRAELQSMPETLDETYERILGSVPDVHRELVQSALKWLAFSSRPLLLEELAEAVILRPGHGDFNPASSRLFTAKAIVDLCGVLVAQTTIDPRKEDLKWLRKKGEVEARGRQNFYEKTATVVSLSHYSVKEYLVSSRLQESAFSSYYASEEESNSFIARSCLFYLTQFNQGRVASDLNFQEWPLLEYAAVEWITHWHKAGIMQIDASLRQVYKKLFQPEGVGAYVNWLNIYSPDLDFEDRFGYRHFDPIKQSADLFPQPIYWAALLGDPLLMEPLISRGADIHARGGYFGSVLGVAVFRRHTEVVEDLLNAGASPNTECNRFGSVLQIAAVGGSKYMVERLLRAGADVNAPGGEKWGSALIAAAANQHHDIVSLLIDNGADLNGGVQHTGSALYGAAVAGDVKLARVLLAAGADVNGSPSSHDPSPLYGATKAGSLPLVRLLIADGADANKAGPDDFASAKYPLQIAANNGLSEIVRILLSAGADVDQTDKYRVTALEEAVSHREEVMTICKMLLDAGADINAKSSSTFHDSIFSKAVSYRRYDLARMLIDNGAKLSPRGLSDAVIAYKKAPWVFEAFMERDVDVNVAAAYSGSPLSTPLHVAVMKRDCGDEYVVRKLLERGANVNAIDESHYTTPLVLAAREGSANIVRLLIEFGADIQRTINYSAFEMAIAHACSDGGSLEIAEILLENDFNIAKNTEMA